MGESELAVRHLYSGMSVAPDLTDGLDHLGHAATAPRMAAAKSAAVGVERQSAAGGEKSSVGHELPALALLTEAEVLDRLEHRDGERVVDRRVIDVTRL